MIDIKVHNRIFALLLARQQTKKEVADSLGVSVRDPRLHLSPWITPPIWNSPTKSRTTSSFPCTTSSGAIRPVSFQTPKIPWQQYPSSLPRSASYSFVFGIH